MMSMTAKVMDHVEAHVSKSLIGEVWMRDQFGELQLFKAGVRIIKKNYGRTYWQAGTVHVQVYKFGKNKYEVKL